ncbi:MAG: hypothetical protein F6J87_14900 [Spirulina sp. SIO3F2]|nr:hypothetical protein [Spirulina sp. SIO3F2]
MKGGVTVPMWIAVPIGLVLMSGIVAGVGKCEHLRKGDIFSIDFFFFLGASGCQASEGFYGSFFADRYGDDSHPALDDENSDTWLPGKSWLPWNRDEQTSPYDRPHNAEITNGTGRRQQAE